jgi:hypothetical protein
MDLTSERIDDRYLKVFIVAQAVVAEVLSKFFAVLDGLERRSTSGSTEVMETGLRLLRRNSEANRDHFNRRSPQPCVRRATSCS